ncbi:hypothetical protein SLEP1_g11330 [Rubroshorea leprosula]|uniref:Uncharacterized protein n=1 Tax=Rubroshorea leprosula TaxID=152421 RepID=A0AAV5IJG9_9ROSI|nr:hypothetical protein SLEP1_g11330 [Rubroshorea leprosula]
MSKPLYPFPETPTSSIPFKQQLSLHTASIAEDESIYLFRFD